MRCVFRISRKCFIYMQRLHFGKVGSYFFAFLNWFRCKWCCFSADGFKVPFAQTRGNCIVFQPVVFQFGTDSIDLFLDPFPYVFNNGFNAFQRRGSGSDAYVAPPKDSTEATGVLFIPRREVYAVHSTLHHDSNLRHPDRHLTKASRSFAIASRPAATPCASSRACSFSATSASTCVVLPADQLPLNRHRSDYNVWIISQPRPSRDAWKREPKPAYFS